MNSLVLTNPLCRNLAVIKANPINARQLPRVLPPTLGRRTTTPCTRLRVLTQAVAQVAEQAKETLSTQKFDDKGITIEVSRTEDGFYDVDVVANGDQPDLVMHWAVEGWVAPDKSVWPAGTVPIDDKAVQTPFGSQNRVQVRFPEDSCPTRLVFVLKAGEKWSNSGAGDFAAYLKPPGTKELVDKVIDAEANYTHWSLFNRFCLASELLEAADTAGPEGMALMLTWLRLSSMRQLDWYRNSNYQSKDCAHVQKTIAQRMADKARSAGDPFCRLFARMCLAGLPRGGGNGDDIRHGILNVMRENGIREGHRPGIEDNFLETWHQKLHTNTTPEDVAICEGYIAFLHSGNMDDFWRVAWDVGRVTRESLATMDHPVDPSPCHLPHLIGPMQHYLWILKTTHSGADLDVALEMARGKMDGDLAWTLGDILNNRNEWWVPGKIVEARWRLKEYWMAEGASRDVLLLDIALDNYLRLCVERTDKGSLSADDLYSLVQLVLDNASIASESADLTSCAELWRRVGSTEGRWNTKEWAQLALAASDNVALCLESYADRIASLVQPHANAFGTACKIDESYIVNFSEEVVRSQPVFMLSVLLRYLDPHLRSAAGVGAWQVVSQAHVPAGKVMVLPDLIGIQGKSFEDGPPIVVIADSLSGNEDIPLGIAAVLTSSATDVLSHVAIRARAQGVLLASCFDGEAIAKLHELDGGWVEAGVLPTGDVAVTAREAPVSGAGAAAAGAGSSSGKKVTLAKASGGKEWVLAESEFEKGAVGGKSRNLAILRGKLPDWIGVPSSIALPFGTFERVLKDKSNATVAKAVAAAEKELTDFAKTSKGSGIPPALKQLRTIVRAELVAPAELIAAASAQAAAAGLISSPSDWAPGSAQWQSAWTAICKVWASKWNDRAWLSRIANDVPEADLSMAVLLQTIVPAAYSYVLHTADPLTGAKGHLRGEMVKGMGEALVGNYPGRPLAFEKTSPTATPQLLALPSKREALLPSAATAAALLIARSDSNGEDLEEFAGAGLYSSIPLIDLDCVSVRYAEEPLTFDAEFRSQLLEKVSKVGVVVEDAFGSPQDIEGAVDAAGNVFVVQARPQVL